MSRIIRKRKLVQNGFKNILQILIFLIFNSFLAQNTSGKLIENKGNNAAGGSSDTLKVDKEQLDDVVHSKAENIRNDIPKKMTYLNRRAQVRYQDMTIDADYISIDWTTGNIFARGILDEKGRILKPAVAEQGGKKYEYDQFNYNYKTRSAIAYGARTEESGGVILAEKTKKYSDSVFFMKKGKYTTDEYFIKKKDTAADYYLLAPNIKLIKGKNKSQIVTGPIQMYIEQVPTPLIMPFAILPFSAKRSAGILIPSFGERQDVGFYLNGLGYYQPIGEHFDLRLLADFYTKGSWNFRPEVNYLKKYRYSGNFMAEVGATVYGIKGLSNYSRTNNYRVSWTHRQDTKANPFLTFGASVNYVNSVSFYNHTINNNYIFNQSVLNASQNSSVNVTKRFLNLPITITGTAYYSQNFSTGLTTLRLPDINVAVNQFYLFKPKTGVRTGLLENLTINTGLSLTNYVNATQNEMFKRAMWDKMQTGAKNNITLGTSTPVAKYFTFSLGANIDNVLTNKTLTRYYDPVSGTLENNYNKQIAGFTTFSTSASLQTTLYGMLKFKKDSKILAIRHMMTPRLSFNYSPNFMSPTWGYFRSFYNDRGVLTPYSVFEGGNMGSPSNSGLVESLGFDIGNNLEMKVRSKKDSTGVKKIKIFESFNISGSYNFARSTNKLSAININTQTSLFNNKMNINGSMTIEPYDIYFAPGETVGVLTNNFGHFSVQGFNVQLSYPLSDETFGKKPNYAKIYDTKGEIRNENYYFDKDNYAHFDQAWKLNVNANYAYSRQYSLFGTKVASIGLDGSIKLTPYWTINGNTHYDVITRKLAYTRIGIYRDQRSFTISFNWVPFGTYKVYDFLIGIKANILKDALKYKDRSFNQSGAPF